MLASPRLTSEIIPIKHQTHSIVIVHMLTGGDNSAESTTVPELLPALPLF